MPFAAASAASNQNAQPSGTSSAANCPQTAAHVAAEKAPYHGQKLAPHKLTDLPPATTYMAVYRRIDGCEAPLTMADYRNPRQR
jgi:hypothetical protein